METLKIYKKEYILNNDMNDWKVKDVIFVKELLFKNQNVMKYLEYIRTEHTYKPSKFDLSDKEQIEFYNHEYYNFLYKLFDHFIIDIESYVLERIQPTEYSDMFFKFLYLDIIDILTDTDNNKIYKSAKKIYTLNNVKYHLPKIKHIAETQIAMGYEPFQTFAETRDLLAQAVENDNGDFSYIAKIMVILVRKKDEPYKETLINKRLKLFLELPYSAYLGVFFLLAKALNLQKKATAGYLKIHSLQTKVKQQQR